MGAIILKLPVVHLYPPRSACKQSFRHLLPWPHRETMAAQQSGAVAGHQEEPELKTIWKMKKGEMMAELQARDIPIPEGCSVDEVRALLKANRVSRGVQKKVLVDPMKEFQKMTVDQLNEECLSRDIHMPHRANKGKKLLQLRHWTENNATGNTLMQFGQYQHLTFEEVLQKKPEYVQWAKDQTEPSMLMRRFLKWVTKITSGEVTDDSMMGNRRPHGYQASSEDRNTEQMTKDQMAKKIKELEAAAEMPAKKVQGTSSSSASGSFQVLEASSGK